MNLLIYISKTRSIPVSYTHLNKEYGLEMINEYARVLGDLSIQEVIDKFKN